ncbi:succinyl-diaminopimelate desuccinylase [uncultured Tessaracoccus sp.]|uniref:succinyl-diaminopimelate desuccinylase n=1 Tax=uncultured Tessaracoccus sp. TaxID=905023 RepID=UPI0026246176|nr:succinyl-diaminopimelate desuccinylase [uncultured Tessaracoccus sp.]
MSLDLDAPLATLLAQIVDVESVSGNERALANLVEEALSLPHLELTRDDDCIVARTSLGRPERVVIAGHLDTVPVEANLPSRRDGDVLWGRGTVDMKGGIAVMLKLAAELTEPSRDITWIFYDHEEVDASKNGLGRLARNHPDLVQGDFAVLMEPTSAQIEGGCQGTIRIVFDVTGQAAHSARSWMGVNAIHALVPLLDALVAYKPQQIDVEGLRYREGLNAVAIDGGMANNVIPPKATLTVNYRFAPNKTTDEALAHLRDVFAGHEFRIDDLSPAARPGLDAALAQEFVQAVGGEARPKYGWTDVARFSELGIPAVNYGPGDAHLAHRQDERVDVAELDQCADGLRSWLSTPTP